MTLAWKDCCPLTLALNCAVECLETGALFCQCFWVFKTSFIKERWQLSFQINSLRNKKKNHKRKGKEKLSSHTTQSSFFMSLKADNIFNPFLTSESQFSKPGIPFHCLRGSESKAGFQQIRNILGSPSYWHRQGWWDSSYLTLTHPEPALGAPVRADGSLKGPTSPCCSLLY